MPITVLKNITLIIIQVAKMGRQRAASKDRLGKEELGKINRWIIMDIIINLNIILILRVETALLDLGQRVDNQSKDLLDRSVFFSMASTQSSCCQQQHHHHPHQHRHDHNHNDDQGGAARPRPDGEAEGCEQGLQQAWQGGGGVMEMRIMIIIIIIIMVIIIMIA